MKSWYEYSRDVQHKIYENFTMHVSDTEMIHLTSLAIVLQNTIDSPVFGDERKTIFRPIYITYLERTVNELATAHDWKQCASERIRLRKLENSVFSDRGLGIASDPLRTPQKSEQADEKESNSSTIVEVDECESCYEFDSHAQLLRLSRARLQLFIGCQTKMRAHSLLYDMVALYVRLRHLGRQPNDVDIYLFFQTTYALTRLHDANYIYLTNRTKNRYFTLWLMFFVEYYMDSTLVWEDYSTLVSFISVDQKTNHLSMDNVRELNTRTLRQLFTLMTSLLFVRRQQIPDSCLHVSNHPDTWDAFVRQINQSSEVMKLRKAYFYAPFLFTLDIHKTIAETDTDATMDRASDSNEILTFSICN